MFLSPTRFSLTAALVAAALLQSPAFSQTETTASAPAAADPATTGTQTPDPAPSSDSTASTASPTSPGSPTSPASPESTQSVVSAPQSSAPSPEALAASPQPWVTLPSGLSYQIVRPGTGPEVTTGATVLIHYRLTSDKGEEWDNSRSRVIPKPFKFKQGSGFVVAGMDQGVLGMKVGERRLLHVPSAMGYGERQAGGIPPNSRLHFDVELVGIKPPDPAPTPAAAE